MMIRWRSATPFAAIMAIMAYSSTPFEVARAQSGQGMASRPKATCTDVDFLEGAWDVRDAKGTLDASLNIKLDEGHCSSIESWQFTPAFGGKQVNCLMIYASAQADWAKICTGFANGDRYISSGGKRIGKELRFKLATNDTVNGTMAAMTLTPLPDGRVRELVRRSADGGKNWHVADEIYYSRRK